MAHKPRKRFGQNFLQDPVYQQRIADSIQLREGAKCVEIGPGKGAITRLLLERFGSIAAIELDRDLVDILRDSYSGSGLRIYQGDVLDMNIEEIAAGQRLSLIGNLPYNISSPLLFKLMDSLDVIDEMVFMLQKEVVDRLTAAPGSKTYGRLSVTTGLMLRCEKLFDVPPGAFFPAPRVMSSVVRMRPLEDFSDLPDRHVFGEIVKAAFSQRRKTIRNSLSNWVNEAQLQALDIDPTARAEQLGIDVYIRLARYCSQPGPVNR